MSSTQADQDACPAPPYPEPDLSKVEKGVETPGLSELEPEFPSRPLTTPRSVTSPWVGLLLFLLCILMHVVLVGFHVVLVVFHYRLNGDAFKIHIPSIVTSNFVTEKLFEKVTLLPNIVIKVRPISIAYQRWTL